MNKLSKVILFSLFVATINSGVANAKDESKRVSPNKVSMLELKKELKRAKTKHKVGKAKAVQDKRKRELVKRYKTLNKRVMSAPNTANTEAYIVRYAKLNKELDAFANGPGGAEGGIASCMGACDDEYPGLGGGAGMNRAACKFACLVHGGDNS